MRKSNTKEGILISPTKAQEIQKLSESIEKASMLIYKYCNENEMLEEFYCLSPITKLLKTDSENLGNILDELFFFNN